MRGNSQKALKEWASVVKALEKGQQIFLLRKGGIAEKNGAFRMEESEFFLFPTFEHQDKEKLKPSVQGLVDEAQKQAQVWAGKIALSCYAEVTEVFQVREIEPLLKLSQSHIWSEEMIRERFNWRPEEPLYIPILRVYRLKGVLLIDALERYKGCKSWIDFDRPIPTKGAKPVLDDMEFQLQEERIRTILLH